ncbi:MAG: MerR family transcriptional regulator [Provencibacterium sp.]|jgi:DNA-binding transcriptional MerR regulator|nr:MerR family transcriptional regulator [Provencibacterium sp.]
MRYTISQAAKKMHLTPFTIRYYDKEGILLLHRTEKGARYFTESDMEQLEMVCCLKSTGMPVKEIKKYFDLCALGDGTLEQRREIFTLHRDHILEEIDQLQKNLAKIERKIQKYDRFVRENQEKAAEAKA